VALFLEITSPGFGVPGTIAILCFAVVFASYALLGTVGSIELVLFVLGLVLLFVARRVMRNIEAAVPRRVVVPEVVGAEGEVVAARPNQDELVQREITKFVQDNPEAAGRMLEGWVEGEE
jgi:hypothetical protein